jgi:hypothetical protein
MSYNVYLIADLGAPRDHHAIFVQTDITNHSGYIFQVTGNVQQGMSFGHKAVPNPEHSPEFVSKQLLGTVSHANYHRIQQVVESVQAPEKQFDGPRRIYPSEPLRRCQEWTAEAVEALRSVGVLEA